MSGNHRCNRKCTKRSLSISSNLRENCVQMVILVALVNDNQGRRSIIGNAAMNRDGMVPVPIDGDVEETIRAAVRPYLAREDSFYLEGTGYRCLTCTSPTYRQQTQHRTALLVRGRRLTDKTRWYNTVYIITATLQWLFVLSSQWQWCIKTRKLAYWAYVDFYYQNYGKEWGSTTQWIHKCWEGLHSTMPHGTTASAVRYPWTMDIPTRRCHLVKQFVCVCVCVRIRYHQTHNSCIEFERKDRHLSRHEYVTPRHNKKLLKFCSGKSSSIEFSGIKMVGGSSGGVVLRPRTRINQDDQLRAVTGPTTLRKLSRH